MELYAGEGMNGAWKPCSLSGMTLRGVKYSQSVNFCERCRKVVMDLEKEGFLFEKVEQFLKNEALTQVH